MSSLTPRLLSGRIAFAVSAVATLLYFFLVPMSGPADYVMILAFFFLIFFLCYFLLKFTIERYVEDKLSVIYQTIHQLKKGERNSTKKTGNSGDKLDQVNEEVLDWYRDNQKELDRLTVLEKYRREFIGNVSHELKTPVFNIQGYLLTLLEGGLEDKSINRKFLERAEKSVEKLIKLLNELDMIIRLDTGGVQLDIQAVNLIEVVNEVIESLELKSEKKEIKIKVNRKNMEALWVMADEDKISQVLSNLLINSIKYGKEKGRTDVSFHDLKNQILVEIKDNGMGIRETELSRIFDRFYRTENARAHDQKGFGLGLSIVKHIIEAHGQTIHVNSVQGEGATFSFTLKKASKK